MSAIEYEFNSRGNDWKHDSMGYKSIDRRFRSRYESKIDGDGNLIIPEAFISTLSLLDETRLVVSKLPINERCLRIYTQNEFESLIHQIDNYQVIRNQCHSSYLIDLRNKQLDSRIISFISNNHEMIKIDKNGYIGINKKLAKLANIAFPSNVICQGMLSYMGLWDIEEYTLDQELTASHFIEFDEQFAEFGIF